jgi:hypothetical protein
MNDITDQIIKFESGDMTQEDMLPFFQHLVDSGLLASMSESYKRTAQALRDGGLIS